MDELLQGLVSRDEFCEVSRKAGMADETSLEIYSEVIGRYAEPHRAYHNLDHIAEMLGLFVASERREDLAIRLAIWFHDVIYDPLSGENEEASAALFRNFFEGSVSAGILERVTRLILVTKHGAVDTKTEDELLLCDIDLSILGADRRSYETYRLAIREEYNAIPDDIFVQGRIAVLEEFLSKPIYRTTAFRSRESRARGNLLQELKALKNS